MPAQHTCPLCQAPWRAASSICHSCGADLTDPDVQAMIKDAGGALPSASQSMPGIASGTLSVGKFMGVRREGLVDGSGLRIFGLVGGLLLLLAFFLPAIRTVHYQYRGIDAMTGDRSYKKIVDSKSSWTVFKEKGSPKVALLFPLIAGLVGIAVSVVPRVPGHVRAKVLALLGLAGFVLCVGQLGEFADTPRTLLHLTTFGMIAAGIAVTARLLMPQSTAARQALIAAAAVVVIGYLIPASDMRERLPVEFQFHDQRLQIDFSDAMPIAAIAGGMKKVDWREEGKQRSGFVVEILFLALLGLLPLVLVPATAAVAWKRAHGVWDKSGLALRPLAGMIVLYLPIAYALYCFNAMGWDDERASSAMFGRGRLLVIVLPLALWAQFGLLSAIASSREGHAETGPEPVLPGPGHDKAAA